MDVVYRYRSTGGGDELRYSLRSLKNIPHNTVWIVGQQEPWLTNVKLLRNHPVTQNKWENSRKNLLVACQNQRVSDDFILMDDDFYITHPMESIPVWHRGTLNETLGDYANRAGSTYLRGLRETAELLKWAGVTDDILVYNLHIPMVINKAKMLECMDYLKGMKIRMPQCFHIRTWYGNFWQLGGERASDNKVLKTQDSVKPGPFLSSTNAAFNSSSRVRKYLQALLPQPSRYEKS